MGQRTRYVLFCPCSSCPGRKCFSQHFLSVKNTEAEFPDRLKSPPVDHDIKGVFSPCQLRLYHWLPGQYFDLLPHSYIQHVNRVLQCLLQLFKAEEFHQPCVPPGVFFWQRRGLKENPTCLMQLSVGLLPPPIKRFSASLVSLIFTTLIFFVLLLEGTLSFMSMSRLKTFLKWLNKHGKSLNINVLPAFLHPELTANIYWS